MCRKYRILLHPEKFFPFALEVECLGIQRTPFGSKMTKKHKLKLLEFEKPKTAAEMQSVLGAFGYIRRYIYHFAFFEYWLQRLQLEQEKSKKLVWNDAANQAWNAIMFLIKNAPLLRNPNNTGKMCIKVDGSQLATGAVLWQQQFNEKTGKMEWVIIDMFSKIMPQHLRKAHCSIHETCSIVWPIQHWVVHLIRAPFIIATDHKALVSVFKPNKDLTDITKKQLYRLILAISDFDFEIKHVKGLDNQIADALSRHIIKLKEKWIVSPDLPYKENIVKLSEKELIELDKQNQEWIKLVKKCKHNKSVNIMNFVDIDTFNPVQLCKIRVNVEKEKYRSILAASNSSTVAILKPYLVDAVDYKYTDSEAALEDKIYKRFERCKDLLSNIKHLKKACEQIAKHLHKMNDTYLNEIKRVKSEYYKQYFKRNKLYSDKKDVNFDNTNNSNANNIVCFSNHSIDNCDCHFCEDIERCGKNEYNINLCHTRSYWRNFEKNKFKHSFIEPHVADIQSRILYQQQFLRLINDYRQDIEFLNPKIFRKYQKSDNICNTIYKFMKNPQLQDVDQEFERQLNSLQTNNINLFNDLMSCKHKNKKKHKLRINKYK